MKWTDLYKNYSCVRNWFLGRVLYIRVLLLRFFETQFGELHFGRTVKTVINFWIRIVHPIKLLKTLPHLIRNVVLKIKLKNVNRTKYTIYFKNNVELMHKLYWKIKVGLSPSKIVYFIFSSMEALQIWWKMLFISSGKLFSFASI